MKHIHTLFFSLCLAASSSAYAQYKIDLSKVGNPDLAYLNLGNPGKPGSEIRVNNLYMEEGGKPVLPVMGEFHYSRMDERYWRDALLKMKASGINIVSTYCLWSLHEEIEGEISWQGHLDLRRFVNLCKELGLKVHLRIGPYCNAEIRHGGLPDWLVSNGNLNTRSNDPLYLEYTRRWYRAIFEQIKGLQWKDGGPIMAIQLENEYVTSPDLVVAHLLTLKRMAVEIGFDLPLYSMTHWMDSNYPKGEIVPYAGFYIERPWSGKGKEELETSNFEYFTYDRLSDNIGTDIIKKVGSVQTLSSELNDSPFFTCEIGVGTTAFYKRRAIVPEEMAGEMINLRLGCGANLMGYYMYVGGSNPVGKLTTMQSSGPKVGYDYQAPIREFGTLGVVMKETKKLNYFMNDFGQALAPAVSYLPNSNENRENLQWAVRLDGNSGYLFCSNYLYKHDRKDYGNVRFSVKLNEETLKLPRNKCTVRNGAYFLWPFNQSLAGVKLVYATAQPVCSMKEGTNETFFFFEDDGIPAEYLISDTDIKAVSASGGTVVKEKRHYFVKDIQAGKDCSITLTKADGTTVNIVTLTEPESDRIWKGNRNGKETVLITDASVTFEDERITLISDTPETEAWVYGNGSFKKQAYRTVPHKGLKASFRKVAPLAKSLCITPAQGNVAKRTFTLRSLSDIERAYLRYSSTDAVTCSVNGKKVESKPMAGYRLADVSSALRKGNNEWEFGALMNGVKAEIEVLLKNGERLLWTSDATWTAQDGKTPVKITKNQPAPSDYDPEEHLAVYEIFAPEIERTAEEARLYLSYKGDVANAYLGGRLVNDSFYDGSDWILSLTRLKGDLTTNPLTIRIDGFQSADVPIYFEKCVNPAECVIPTLSDVKLKQEYRFEIH